MEKGQMRVELNISVSDDPKKFGTMVEVKNINSFKAVERAAKFETERMIELLEAGKGSEIVQETRGWDETKQITFSQRSKENAQDYRYFPDPDLPKLVLKDVFDIADLRKNLPELPEARRIRYSEQFGIKSEDVENYINDFTLAGFFEDVVTDLKGNKEKIKLASNYISSDLIGLMKKDSTVEFPHSYHFAELIEMLFENLVSSRGAKELLVLICKNDESPRKLAEENNLIQKNNSEELEAIIKSVIENNSKVVDEYKAGKEASLQFLIGQVMKESKGSANPGVAKQLLIDLLK
jgi:aspartyl-tRNA(Asn)/glutamyl-tRNA(Gln) amidotransferase subunit B